MHRSRLVENAALVICIACLAMLLHNVDSLDEDTAGLGIDAQHLSLLALVVTAHHADGVALRDVHSHALDVDAVACGVPLLCGFSVLQIAHATKPPGPARRSSCTSFPGARGLR